jgi:hypothetical protein
MRFNKDLVVALAFALAVGVGAAFFFGCGEDAGPPTAPEVQYKDQTFALLVCDGNGNGAGTWHHDGAAVCTLDWNGDGAGPNRVAVTYVYDDYPLVDGAAEQLKAGLPKGGDYWLWEKTPWTAVKTGPVMGEGSGVKEVWVKALYTYIYPPRIWFFFRWEDPSHTIKPATFLSFGVGGTQQYYWHLKAGSKGRIEAGRRWASREDWLAVVWSTWFSRNEENKGKADKNEHKPADINGGDWHFVETVPGFQEKGITLLRGGGDVAYRTPTVYTNDPNSPYYDKYYPGPYCDFWYFSASRSNYNGEGWDGSAWLFDCYVDEGGFKKPEVGSNENPKSLDEYLLFDAGVPGYEANGGVTGWPAYWDANPTYNPPGPTYLWKPTAVPFAPQLPLHGDFVVPGYLHRPPAGSAADVVCRCRWQFPGEDYYPPWEGYNGDKLKENYYARDWHYTLEVMREIGTVSKIEPVEDVFLGIFDPR